MADIASMLSAIGPGFIAGQGQIEQNKFAQLRNQEMMDEKASLAALGRAFGVAPPTTPAPIGPGQASVPAHPAPAPAAPVEGRALGAPTAPVMPPPAVAPPGAPTPAPARPGAPQLPFGQMSADQLAQRIVRANPGIEKRPDLLVRAMAKGQALLAPQGKAELAMLQIQQRVEAANNKLELGQMTLQMRQAMLDQANEMKLRIEQLRQSGMNSRAADKTTAMLEALTAKLLSQQNVAAAHDTTRKEVAASNNASRKDIAAGHDTAANARAAAGTASREKIAGERTRAQVVGLATKAGVKVDPAWTDAEVQQHTADAVAKKGAEGQLSDDEAHFLAHVIEADPTQASHVVSGWGKGGQQNRTKVWDFVRQDYSAQGKPPADLATARVAILGTQQAARTAGAQTAKIGIGLREIDKFAPLVIGASEKVDRTRFPTVNSLIEASQRGTGGTQIVQLVNYINALKNAYAQVLARGGSSSVDARKRADEVVNAAWSKGQIKAAIEAMRNEARQAESASTETMGAISSGAGRAATPSTSASDPLGILK